MRRTLGWSQVALFACAALLLSYCGFVMVDAWVFQQRESRDLNRLLANHPLASHSKVKLERATAVLARGLIGRLEIPRLNLAVMVREGADERTLSRAVGHIPGTALPGNVGNVGLAGHRDTFFRSLRNIRADDTIELETTAGTYRYVVKSTRIVTPRDVSVLEASGGETLTLVTCYPFYYVGSAPKRFIVHAALMHEAPEVAPSGQRHRQARS